MKNNKFISISFIKFLVTGFINTFSSFGLYVLLLKLNCNYIAAIVLSYIFGIILSYLLNTFFVFETKKEIKNKYGDFGILIISKILEKLTIPRI